jgi:hypothetical protein
MCAAVGPQLVATAAEKTASARRGSSADPAVFRCQLGRVALCLGAYSVRAALIVAANASPAEGVELLYDTPTELAQR